MGVKRAEAVDKKLPVGEIEAKKLSAYEKRARASERERERNGVYDRVLICDQVQSRSEWKKMCMRRRRMRFSLLSGIFSDAIIDFRVQCRMLSTRMQKAN